MARSHKQQYRQKLQAPTHALGVKWSNKRSYIKVYVKWMGTHKRYLHSHLFKVIMIKDKWSNRKATVKVYVNWTFICKLDLCSHLCKVKFTLHIMFADQVQLHYYYNCLIRIVMLCWSQAIKIHMYPMKGYKSKYTHLFRVLLFIQYVFISVLRVHVWHSVEFGSLHHLGLVSLQIIWKPLVHLFARFI